MKALPSIAFGGFSGSAKGVTARQVGGRTVLSVRGYPTGPASSAQVVRRASLSRIAKAWKRLTEVQMKDWERLAQHCAGASILGQKAQLSGINLFVRLNANRAMAGEGLRMDAPASVAAVPDVSYSQVIATPQLVVFSGIRHQPSPYKLVVKMSASQSAGVSSGWSRTVIVSSEVEDDWGEADVTELYLKTLGAEPVPGQKVFVETYWLDTETGFTGQALRDCVVVTGESSYVRRMRVTMDDAAAGEEPQFAAMEADFSTGLPVVYIDAVCLGHGGVASSEVYLERTLPDEYIGLAFALGRAAGDDGKLTPQSYQLQTYTSVGRTKVSFMHRGGGYVEHSEVFGPGVFYKQ